MDFGYFQISTQVSPYSKSTAYVFPFVGHYLNLAGQTVTNRIIQYNVSLGRAIWTQMVYLKLPHSLTVAFTLHEGSGMDGRAGELASGLQTRNLLNTFKVCSTSVCLSFKDNTLMIKCCVCLQPSQQTLVVPFNNE